MPNPAKIKKVLSQTSLVLAAGRLPAAAFGGVFVITDDACPAAHGDLEAHLNWESGIATSHGRSVGSGAGLEFAYGATATLEVAASLDFGWDYASGHYARKTGGERQNDFNFTGVSLGLKNQILDPESPENPFGLAMVGGFSWGWAAPDKTSARDIAFSLGLNFQKNLMDGDLILAFTPGVEFATSKGSTDAYGNPVNEDSSVDSIAYTLAGGFSYQIAEGLRVGAEAEWSASYSDGYDDDAFYAGPNICYEAESWWATLCVAPRLFSRDPELGHDVRVVVQLGYVF